jgi:hypothetical protein
MGAACQPSDESYRTKRMMMTAVSLQELGPVDYVVVEFPAGASNFTGEMVEELLALVEGGTIRVIDVLILTKSEDGSVEVMESVSSVLRWQRPRSSQQQCDPVRRRWQRPRSWPLPSHRVGDAESDIRTYRGVDFVFMPTFADARTKTT